jgi:hypothetical protein
MQRMRIAFIDDMLRFSIPLGITSREYRRKFSARAARPVGGLSRATLPPFIDTGGLGFFRLPERILLGRKAAQALAGNDLAGGSRKAKKPFPAVSWRVNGQA